MLKGIRRISLLLAAAVAVMAVVGCRQEPAAEAPEATETADAAPEVRVRKEWHSLSAEDRAAYAAAVGLMKTRPETSKTSWLYQANIHGFPSDDSVCSPPGVTPQTAWATCQHGGFFFLAWHRMYLYYFEQIVQAAAREALKQPDYVFNLPYWDYEEVEFNRLPEEFRVPAESSNALYVQKRVDNCNDGSVCISQSVGSATEALKRIPFCNCPVGTACPGCVENLSPRQAFGSQFTATPQHGNRNFGELESQPHNVVHDAIGGDTGWMGDPDCAARDPIFWLHHANIDRLWQVWLNQGNRANPLGAENWKNQPFTFFDGGGNEVRLTGCQILNMATQLGYEYDGVPVENVQLCPPETAEEAVAPPPPAPQAEMLVALPAREVHLGNASVSVPVPVPGEMVARMQTLAAGAPKKAWLVVEGLKQLNKGVYFQVYLNLPEKQTPDPAGAHFVGNISLFGSGHQGEGEAEHAFDITDELNDLRAQGLWTGDLRVTFVPGNPPGVGVGAEARHVSFSRIYIKEQ